MNARTKLGLSLGVFSTVALSALVGFGILNQINGTDAAPDTRYAQASGVDMVGPPGTNPDAQANAEHPPARTESAKIEKGSTVSQTLKSLGIPQKLVAQLSTAAKDVKNLAQMPAGTEVTVTFQAEADELPQRVTFKLSQTQTLVLEAQGAVDAESEVGDWSATIDEAKVDKKLVSYSGVVKSSLWNSAEEAGMDPQLIHKIAEVFAWQIDFNREVQLDDRWRLSVEELSVNGKPIGYGDVIASEYENAGVVSTAIRYEVPGDGPQYFQPDGNSIRRMFLKSPLKYGRITSGFSLKRFHPILGINRAHKGIDYGAPTGTPIMAVGDGVVEQAGYRGPSGNEVVIRHSGTYTTRYKHMSKFASGIKSGTKVQMSQIIGYVGSTGLATGPHLHFEFWESGRFVDPQGMRFPSADPVPAKYKDQFGQTVENALAQLPAWSRIVLSEAKRPARKDDMKATSALLPKAKTVPTE